MICQITKYKIECILEYKSYYLAPIVLELLNTFINFTTDLWTQLNSDLKRIQYNSSQPNPAVQAVHVGDAPGIVVVKHSYHRNNCKNHSYGI